MRLDVAILGCRLLIATGNDTDQGDAPTVVSNVSGSFDVAALPEPETSPEEDFGFRR